MNTIRSLGVKGFFSKLSRTKDQGKEEQSNKNASLSRCLDVFDLTGLGVGSTLGLGLYVLTGKIAAELAGPAVIVSWLIAAVASAFSGLCYAEFGARVPCAGSAYVYSYVTVGEFIAFIIGWNMILEYIIGTAGVASGYSAYLNSLMDNKVADGLRKVMPMNNPNFNKYPDFLSFGLVAVVTGLLSFGVKESTKFNNICTCLNMLIVVYVVICGAFKVDFSNWAIKKEDIPGGVPNGGGNGGFAPYGMNGIIKGAAKCFFGFVGFDIVATTGEEVKDPKKSIPRAFCASLIIIFVSYESVAIIQTLIQPYYIQKKANALPFVFQESGYPVAWWIISIGALAGLSTSMLGAMFPLPRVLYAMASDGVIYRWLGKVNPKTKTPIIATVLAGLLAGAMAVVFSVNELIDMMSIGTLMAYTLVAVSVLLLRYKHSDESSKSVKFPLKEYFRQALNLNKQKVPNLLSYKLSIFLIYAIGISSVTTALFPALFVELITDLVWWAVTIFVISACILISSVVILFIQPQDPVVPSFTVPLVPLVPSLGIFVNIYLMLSLDAQTWIRFAVWMAIGFIIYFSYGIFNSDEEYIRKGLEPPNTTIQEDKQPTSSVMGTERYCTKL